VCGSKPAQANSSVRLYLEKPFTKIGLVEWLKVKALNSGPSAEKKKKKKKPHEGNVSAYHGVREAHLKRLLYTARFQLYDIPERKVIETKKSQL
jgi:hypothetical protein